MAREHSACCFQRKIVIDTLTAQGLNQSALDIYESMVANATELRIAEHQLPCGARLLDCGVKTQGGLAAGIEFAKVCLAGKANVSLTPGNDEIWPGAWVQVDSDHAVLACMFGQYAGWPVKHEQFFAMGSGPMRVKRGREEILTHLDAQDTDPLAIGTLECDAIPDCQIATHMAAECGVAPTDLRLAIAPTRSIAGCVQVVARSIETALHKMHELEFPLTQVVSAHGVAPLPPGTPDFAEGIGRTNDAILYGATVTLWLSGDDEQIEQVSKRVPSNSSSDHGAPFVEIFKRYNFDFYKVDPGLFSPARLNLINLATGRSWQAGELRADLIAQSFGLASETP